MIARATVAMVCLLAGSAIIAGASRAEPTLLRKSLNDLPMAWEGWTGMPAPRFDERTIALLGVDEYVNRTYVDANRLPVGLYVGFYASQREGDTMHSPLNCLPGSGWQPISRGRTTLAISDAADRPARPIEVNQLVIEKGAERQVVLYWYQSRGRVTASEYWSKAFTVADAIRLNRTDGAILRITAPIAGDAALAHARAAEFARSLFPRLTGLLPL